MATLFSQRFPLGNNDTFSGPPRNPTSSRSRGDGYNKLKCRFYEALILLQALGQTRALRDINPGQASTLQERRRRLLCNLSYLCDYTKGGDSTTAIGLGEQDDLFIFWVASNVNESNNKVLRFLKLALAEIKRILGFDIDQQVLEGDGFTRTCINFAKSRVNKEVKLLWSMIRGCRNRLDLQGNTEDIMLWNWLQEFLGETNYFNICERAYKQRRAREMKYMETKIGSAHEGQAPSETSSAFELVRHLIGRVAHHYRAPKQLIEDFSRLSNLLDPYDVRQIRQTPSISPPEADALTTLEGIVRRMLPAKDPSLREYEDSLPVMNHRLRLEDNILKGYSDPNFKPKVHAEVRVLEHFYENKIRFVDNDRYIGCSKPACFCCRLYFRHHPLRCVEPIAHHNIWLNWGPPALPGGIKDPKYKHQRKILNSMLPTIRKEALDQLKMKAGPLERHPDSHTGITPSDVYERSNNIRLAAVEAGFAAMNFESAEPSTSDNEDIWSSSPEHSSASSVGVGGSSSSHQSDASSEDEDSDEDDGGAAIL